MKTDISKFSFKDLENKTFNVVKVIDKLCEFCGGVVETEENAVEKLTFTEKAQLDRLMVKAKAHDSIEVDVEEGKIYIRDHRYPIVFHPECVLKTGRKEMK